MNKLKDILLYVKKNKSINEIMEKYNHSNEKSTKYSNNGLIYECLWYLMFVSNSVDKYKNNTIYYGNPNKLLKKFKFSKSFLNENINKGCSNGCSDISFVYKNRYYFTSCKYFKNDKKKSIDNYDIHKIRSICNESRYKNKSIILIVNNKNEVLEKIKKTNLNMDDIDCVFGRDDLENFYKIFQKNYINIGDDVFVRTQNTQKLNPRFHQRIFTQNTLDLIDKKKDTFVYAWKCRSGKTYGVGNLFLQYINQFLKDNEYINCMIITPVPKETIKQFTDELFCFYENFKDFNINEIKNGEEFKNIKIKKDKHNITILSKQLLQNFLNKNKIKFCKHLDFIVFDENHYTGTTDLSKEIIKTYQTKDFTIKLFLTATYNKTITSFNIENNCIFNWTLEDEMLCKKRNFDKLSYNHNIYTDIYEHDLECYDICPEMVYMTSLFDEEKYKDYRFLRKYDYSMSLLFELTKNQSNEITFKNFYNVFQMLKYINDFVYSQISNHSIENNSRTIIKKNFISQLWFLPPKNIKTTSNILCNFMKEQEEFKDFDILQLNYSTNDNQTLNDRILESERIAKQNDKKGLIILAGKQCVLGITLTNVDVVFLLNDSTSYDTIVQMKYRCMSEGVGKKFGYVIDFNIHRVLKIIMETKIRKPENLNSIDKKLKFLTNNNMINIFVDGFNLYNSNEFVNKLTNIYKLIQKTNVFTILNKLDKYNVETISKEDLLELLNIGVFNTNKKNSKKIIEIENENKQEKETKTKLTNETKTKTKDSTKKIEIEIDEKDLLKYIIPFVSVITFEIDFDDLQEMFNYIKSDNCIYSVFKSQLIIWWDKLENNNIIFDKLIEILIKTYNKNNLVISIIKNVKEQMNYLLDKPVELMNFINMSLKPKEEEKKQYGEVFTPIFLIKEMLEELELQYGNELFKDKNLKWFDPAVGIGNFLIVVYQKLMVGLKKEFENVQDRKKHIIENMLYASELNEKNCFVYKKIFNGYKINLYEGSSIQITTSKGIETYTDVLDIEKDFGIEKFDIVVGNPPFNKGSTNTGNSIWKHFTITAINQWLKNDGYLCFIHPPGWRKPQTEYGNFVGMQKLMTVENTMKYLSINSSKVSKKIFINTQTRFDWYILQKKQNKNGEKTIIINEIENNNYHLNNKTTIYYNKIDLTEFKHFIPNSRFNFVKKFIIKDNEKPLDVIYSRNNYGSDKTYTSNKRTKIFKYPLIHTILKDGIVNYYTNKIFKNDNMFNVKKLIIAKNKNIYHDKDGLYGLTELCFAIKYKNNKHCKKIMDYLENENFIKFVESCSWSTYAYDWILFTYIKEDFYNYS